MPGQPLPDETIYSSRPQSRRLFVTLRRRNTQNEVDLELPGDQPIGVLIPDILKVLGWPAADGERLLRYRLHDPDSEKPLPEDVTLNAARIENSSILIISLDEAEAGIDTARKAPAVPQAVEQGLTRGFVTGAAAHESPQDRRGALAPPHWVDLVVKQPSLVSEAGVIFVLGAPPLMIGRAGRGQRPNIDLTELDTRFVSSRKHAEISLDGTRYAIRDLGSMNGTFVNGGEVHAGARQPLQDGDVILFGVGGVQLTFRAP